MVWDLDGAPFFNLEASLFQTLLRIHSEIPTEGTRSWFIFLKPTSSLKMYLPVSRLDCHSNAVAQQGVLRSPFPAKAWTKNIEGPNYFLPKRINFGESSAAT